MPHPENAYAFNEHSLKCCGANQDCGSLASLIDVARAWRMHESGPLVQHLKARPEFDALRRDGKYRDKVLVLLDSAINRAPIYDQTHDKLRWEDGTARGMTVANELGGFVLSWPCGCQLWRAEVVEGTHAEDGQVIRCRHVSSEDHLRIHWLNASKKAGRARGRPRSVDRIDDAMNTARGEVPQVHFTDGSALNIDGAWKHGGRDLTADEVAWLVRVGWVLPEPSVEVR